MGRLNTSELTTACIIFVQIIALLMYGSSYRRSHEGNSRREIDDVRWMEGERHRHITTQELDKEIQNGLVKSDEELKWFRNSTAASRGQVHIRVLVIVSSAPSRKERRQGIRETWWSWCASDKVSCLFFTDGLSLSPGEQRDLLDEQSRYGDMAVQPLGGGAQFGDRFLYHLRWSFTHFMFDYFIRIDDDMFLCLDRLLHDIPSLPKTNYLSGWFHCESQLVRPEESFVVISRDIVAKFLSQDARHLMCHPFADQQMAIWAQSLRLTNRIYYHDKRIHHDPPASQLPAFNRTRDICQSYISIHGTYPKEMRLFWTRRGSRTYPESPPQRLHTHCSQAPFMNWRAFGNAWRYQPRLCQLKPTWDMSAHVAHGKKLYEGREKATRKRSHGQHQVIVKSKVRDIPTVLHPRIVTKLEHHHLVEEMKEFLEWKLQRAKLSNASRSIKH